MSLEPLKSLYQVCVEARNFYARRMIEKEVDILYWKEIRKQTKANTQERVDADNMVATRQKEFKQDKLLIKQFDLLIVKYEKQSI